MDIKKEIAPMLKLSLFLASTALAAASPTPLVPFASAGAAAPMQLGTPNVQAWEVAEAVRRAVGYRNLAAFQNGIAFAEQVPSGPGRELALVGTRSNAVRFGDEFGLHGAYRWQRDPRRGA